MGGPRAGMEALDRVVRALEGDRPLAAPEGADDRHCLLQGLQRLTTRPHRPAHRGDRLPEATRAEAELEASAREHVQRRGLLGEDGRAPEREVCDVRKEPDPLGPGDQIANQGEGVEEPPLIRMVLDPDQIQLELVGAFGEGA
jgi:hypothetical protein